MSRYAFISDIHGNWPALQAVLADIDTRNVNQTFCLGDLVGYYAQINEVIECIRQRNIKTIIGNHDYAMVHTNGIIERSKTCTNVLTKQLTYIKDDNLDFLRKLPNQLVVETEFGKILCMHGGLNDYIDEYLPPLTNTYFASLDPTIKFVITAHNHKPAVMHFDKLMYGNCGSVGQPRDHNPRASYLIWDNGIMNIRRVCYNINQTREAMRSLNFEDYISDVLYKGYHIGE